MAIIDEELQSSDFDEIEETLQATPEPKQEVVSEVPDKYRGKSLGDIVKMHQEAEKLIGKQAQEVGEVRKLADELLKQQLSKDKPPTEEETEIDFFEDPKKAVSKAVENHPDVVAAREAAQEFKAQKARNKLLEKHADMPAIASSPEFIEWVKASPTRVRLFMDAESKYDMDAADELLTTFKELRAVKVQQSKDDGVQLRNQNLKAAAVDTGGTGETPKKVYRRADLIRLRMTDPSRYDALQDDILKAYQEGRVK